jgi:hypothetical protein
MAWLAQGTFRFRHTGNLQAKFAEARQVLGMTIDYERQFKVLADRLACEPMTERALEHRVLRYLWVIDEDTDGRARANGERASSKCSPSPRAPRSRTRPPTIRSGIPMSESDARPWVKDQSAHRALRSELARRRPHRSRRDGWTFLLPVKSIQHVG